MCKSFGITGDAGVTFGSQLSVDYTKVNLFAGVTYIPFKNMGPREPFAFSLHALAGLTSITAKTGSFNSTGGNLGGDLGVNPGLNLNKHWVVQGNAGWNPVFSSGSTSSNYRFGLGLRLNY